MRRLSAAILIIATAMAACAESDTAPEFQSPADVYAALLSRLEEQDDVLHATAISVETDGSDVSTRDYWIDEARDLAREVQDFPNVIPKDRGVLIVDGEACGYAGDLEPNCWEAASCDGVSAPATSLLLLCDGVAGSQSELVDGSGDTLQIVTTGSYDGADVVELESKPYSLTLTLHSESLMPISFESDSWAVLNGEPYESHSEWTYETEFVDRDSLPSDFFELE